MGRYEQEYKELETLAAKAEKETGLYLWDSGVDSENAIACGDYGTDDYWQGMVFSGRSAFGDRCAEHGLDPETFGISH
jgi:hypothetical protein